MNTECAKQHDGRTRDACENVAFAYYSSVRVFGVSFFCNVEGWEDDDLKSYLASVH